MVVCLPFTKAIESPPERHSISQPDGEDKQGNDQVDNRIAHFGSMFEPGGYAVDIVQVVRQDHKQNREASKLVDGMDAVLGGC